MRRRRIRFEEDPGPKKFKNIVEKQKYYDEMTKKYGPLVQGRQDFMDLYDKPLPSVVPSASTEKDYRRKFDLDTNLTLPTTKADPEDFNLYYTSPPSSINQTWRGVIERNKKRLKVDPTLLYGSLMEEGGNTQASRSSSGRIDGFENFGLDTIGERMDEFVKKGYLDKNFQERATKAGFVNEQGKDVVSAYLNTYDDVLMAKQAFMLSAKDTALNQAKKLNVTLSPKAIDYLMVVGYNYGEGGMKQMMADMAKRGLLQNDKFMDLDDREEYQVPRRNAKRRLQIAEMLRNEANVGSQPSLPGKTPLPPPK